MFQRKMKKLTASLLLFFMVFSIMPVQVWAEESTTGSAIEWVPNEDECTDPSHNHGTEGDNNAGGTEETDEEKAAREEAERLAAEQAAQAALLADYKAEADELLAGYQAAIDNMTLADVEAALAAIDTLDAAAESEMNADTYTAFVKHDLFAYSTTLLNKQDALEQAAKDAEAEKAAQEEKEAAEKAEAERQALLAAYTDKADKLYDKYADTANVADNAADMTLDEITAAQDEVDAALDAIADFDAVAQNALGENYAAWAAGHALYTLQAELVNAADALADAKADLAEDEEAKAARLALLDEWTDKADALLAQYADT